MTEKEEIQDIEKREFIKRGLITLGVAGTAAILSKVEFVSAERRSLAPITPASGGTGNAFTKFTGPTTTEKTFTLPDANATILTTTTGATNSKAIAMSILFGW